MCECMCVCVCVCACMRNCPLVAEAEAHNTRHFAAGAPSAHETPQAHRTVAQGKNVASDDGLLQ
jgi:hypothetical protein